jgi:hypothetical protein
LPEYFPRTSSYISPSPAQTVLLFDCDTRFDIRRLQQIITSFLRSKVTEGVQGGFIHLNPVQNPSEEEISQVVQTALSNLYIFQPTSPLTLLASVEGLPTFLSLPEYGQISLGLLCIDSLSAFHHILRMNEKQHEYYTQLSLSLRTISTLFKIPVITTSWALFTQTTPQIGQRGYLGTGPSHAHSISSLRSDWRQYFPGEWLRGVNVRIVLQKSEVRGFMDGATLAEAEMEKERREEVVKRGTVVGWVEGDEGSEFEMLINSSGVRLSYH